MIHLVLDVAQYWIHSLMLGGTPEEHCFVWRRTITPPITQTAYTTQTYGGPKTSPIGIQVRTKCSQHLDMLEFP